MMEELQDKAQALADLAVKEGLPKVTYSNM
jgi:hypothetical protein